MKNLRRSRVWAVCAIGLLIAAGCNKNDAIHQAEKKDAINGIPVPSLAETKQIAQDGFVFGLPIVMYYTSTYELFVDKTSSQYKAPVGQLFNEARVFTPKDTAVITPNSDTPYSLAEIDLRTEPTVISVPAVPKPRYYSVQLTDANTFNYGYIGSRTTGTGPGDYLVVGPDWKGEKPAGIKEVFHSTTPFSAVIFRTQLFKATDMPNVVKIQAGYKLRPLSQFLKQPAPAAAPAVEYMKVDADIAKQQFWQVLDFALQFIPPSPEEGPIRARLASIGIGPGKKFDSKDLSVEHKAALLLGMKEGDDAIDKFIANGGKVINGWNVGSFFGDRAFYNGDWLKRAAAAKGGIFGNSAVEAMYPLTKVTASGETLDGSKHNYTLTFAKDSLPPVNAFWSVTMYDGKTQFLIDNPINRYLINSPMVPSLKKNADGSLTMYIQKDSPGKDKESNWLPAPDGPIYLVMRLYWPRETPPSILPAGEGTWQPPAVEPAK
ncbi:MAG TPA: DUF1254 domain-containing protein [Verrucomicrobiae bacterium]|nr:DUF1254 domain-containing protein [Verrucomicrobiae bacterium]